jgi:3-dehydroquinate synthase
MKQITVNTQPSYPLYFGDFFASNELAQLCEKQAYQVAIITDNNVETLYASHLKEYFNAHHIKTHTISFPAGEASKTQTTKQTLENQLLQLGCGRDTCIIALGGGVVTDLAGFIAATYCRGVPAIYLPTTLLGIIDASIGGKTGVNTAYGKNTIGTFTQPKAVFIHAQLLETLPDDEYLAAFSEIIKHALISDADYFEFLYTHAETLKAKNLDALDYVIKESFRIKASIVEKDEREQGIRKTLNFGHTMAHAIETVCHYAISHGQAVAIGILVESYLSYKLGLLSEEAFSNIQSCLSLYETTVKTKVKLAKDALKQALMMDKKTRRSEPHFVLLRNIGEVHCASGKYASSVDDQTLDQAIDYLLDQCSE